MYKMQLLPVIVMQLDAPSTVAKGFEWSACSAMEFSLSAVKQGSGVGKENALEPAPTKCQRKQHA